MTEKNREPAVRNLQDLADLAGVSRATASRALNDNPMISARTRQKIQALAEKHSYSIDRRARDFRLSKSSVISVVFMLDPQSKQHMSDPFFLEMLGAIADSLAEHDYDLLLAHAPVTDVSGLRNSRVFRQSDGVIFIGQGEQHEALDELARHERRIVVWGYPVAGKHYVVVGSDNFKGAYHATRHLLELGRRKIAFFGKTSGYPENAARYEGYVAALEEYGIASAPELKIEIPFEMDRAREAVVNVVNSKVYIDGVLCGSDVMALASISVFEQMGVQVPEDVAVVGYDDITLAAYSSPPLTTVRQHIANAGNILVETLMALIKGQEVSDTILDCDLVVRRSSGASPASK